MYRQRFGDSFLLTFNAASEPHHILIDCGVLQGVSHGTQWSRDVARDIYQTTGGRLDVIVATHMHWDHVSGFCDAKEEFSRFKVDEVWLPWTENTADAQAANHQRVRTRQLDAVRRSRSLLGASRDSRSATARAAEEKLDQILAFYGPATDGTEALEAARSTLFSFGHTPRFLERGMLVAPVRLSDVRVYVLGPARDDSLLGFDGYGRDRGFYGALLARAGNGPQAEAEVEATQPFDIRQRWTAEWRRENPLVRHLIEGYEGAGEDWRRIDNDWLFYAAEIADRLHVTVNNLSLSLAFECVGSRDVLLFPGDAQLANWRTLEWKSDEGGTATRVTAQELLARTVFYKAANHGSLNANEVAGVEAMTRPDLVAAITADTAFASAHGLEMPAAAVKARLLQKTQGRLLLPQSDKLTPATERSVQSDRRFVARTHVTALYVDFIIP